MREEIERNVEKIDDYVMQNAKTALNQEIYQRRYMELVSKYETLMKEYDDVKYAIKTKKARFEQIRLFIRALKKQDELISEFDGALWCSLLEYIVVNKDEGTVVFRDGTSIKVSIK